MSIKRLSYLVFLSATVFVTSAATRPASGAELKPVAKAGFSLNEIRIGDAKIPALALSKAGSATAKRPAVILIHGGSVADPVTSPGLPYKEEWFRPVYEDVPYRLASKGMLVVAIDAAWAESRIPPDAREQVQANPTVAVLSYYMAAVRDVSQTIDYLRTLPDIAPDKIGVAGKSGGAITSLMAACQEPRLAVVVSWKGGADFVDMGRRRGQAAAFDEAFKLRPDFADKLKRADPINDFVRIPPKALALINNQDDPLIPRENAEALYQKLRPLYEKRPEKLLLKLCKTDKPTHDDQVEAFDAGCQWLETHLIH